MVKIKSADFQQVTKKVHFFLHFFSKIFGHIKKKQYFCIRFWETNVFLFSTGGPDIKIQILFRGPNFFAPNWRVDEANWKIDTISVVQELNRVVIADIHYSLIIIH